MPSILPTISVGAALASGSTVVAPLAGYLAVALAFFFGPKLLKLGIRLIKGE